MAKRREEWLTNVHIPSYFYRGYEIACRIHEEGHLHVVVYDSTASDELVKVTDNVCKALNWVDVMTKDQVWGD